MEMSNNKSSRSLSSGMLSTTSIPIVIGTGDKTEIDKFLQMTMRPEIEVTGTFKVLTRADFISKLQNNSQQQTKKLLDESQDSCIMIDEAYSLCANPN